MSLIVRLVGALRGRLCAFVPAKGANVSILFAFSMLPLTGLVGLGVDYGIALSTKAKLDNAADTAALAGVATAKAYVAANPSDGNLTADAIAAGTDRATRAFSVNAGSLPFAQFTAPQITLGRTNQTFFSTVSYSATSRNQFGQIFGVNYNAITGTAAASADIPAYLDFYLLLDESGSMGLPSTADGQTKLKSINPDERQASGGCQFACHFQNRQGWSTAVNNAIQLRSGAVNTAVCQLLTKAAAPLVPNQYRVGLYPFVSQMATLAQLSTNFTDLNGQADCASSPPMAFTNLLDTGVTQLTVNNDISTGTGSGGTHFEAVMPSMKNTIISFGDGSSSTKSRPYVFFITDGMDNNQYYNWVSNNVRYYPGAPSLYKGYANAVWTGSQPSAISSSLCAALKQAGATVSILYIPYTPLVVAADNTNIGESNATNNAIPNVPAGLQACASPNFFYTANSPADINAALASMFNQAVQVAHLNK